MIFMAIAKITVKLNAISEEKSENILKFFFFFFLNSCRPLSVIFKIYQSQDVNFSMFVGSI